MVSPLIAALVSAIAISSVSQSEPAARPKIVALGDSLTAGFGLSAGAAFPSRLQAALARLAAGELRSFHQDLPKALRSAGVRRRDARPAGAAADGPPSTGDQ